MIQADIERVCPVRVARRQYREVSVGDMTTQRRPRASERPNRLEHTNEQRIDVCSVRYIHRSNPTIVAPTCSTRTNSLLLIDYYGNELKLHAETYVGS